MLRSKDLKYNVKNGCHHLKKKKKQSWFMFICRQFRIKKLHSVSERAHYFVSKYKCVFFLIVNDLRVKAGVFLISSIIFFRVGGEREDIV